MVVKQIVWRILSKCYWIIVLKCTYLAYLFDAKIWNLKIFSIYLFIHLFIFIRMFIYVIYDYCYSIVISYAALAYMLFPHIPANFYYICVVQYWPSRKCYPARSIAPILYIFIQILWSHTHSWESDWRYVSVDPVNGLLLLGTKSLQDAILNQIHQRAWSY